MASEGKDGALTSAEVGETKPWCSASGGDDLFSHAHQTLLKGALHQQEEEKEDKTGDEERGVRERKRKRRKERIRHIQRIDRTVDMPVRPPHPLLVSLASLTPKDEGLSPQPSTGPSSGMKKVPSRPPAGIPPLLPLSLAPILPPPATPSPPPRPHMHSPTPTPPLTRSLPSSPAPPSPTPTHTMSPPLIHSPSPTRQPSSPASRHTTPSASPPTSPLDGRSRLTPTMEETETEMRRKKKVCGVCGDVARSLHFGGRACDSCKAFFRRAVVGSSFLGFTCVRKSRGGDSSGGDDGGDGEDKCVITVRNRRDCQSCRFSACLKAGMEVSLAAREDECYRGLAPPIGLYRRLSRHAHTHAKNLHGAPYLAGCWRSPYGSSTPVLTPRLKEESTRYSPTGGEAAQHVASVRLAAAPPPPAPTPLVFGYNHAVRQDPTQRYARSPSDRRPAPDVSQAFNHDPSLDAAPRYSHDLPLTPGKELPARHIHEAASARSNDPGPRHRRPPEHTRLLPTGTHTAFRHDLPQGRASSTRTPAMAVHPAPSGSTRLSKWSRSPPAWSAPDFSCLSRPSPPRGGDVGDVGTRAPQPASAVPRQDSLSPQDLAEIKQLQESYVGDQEAVTTHLEECVHRSELGRLYTCFIERRAKFLVSTPLYGTVAAADRPKLLHVAVAMSTYFTGAHHIDISDYLWQQRRGAMPAGREVAVLSASSVRQLLSHQQFLHVMKFYTTYHEALADQTIAILMQVMSLFYPEEGLQAPRPVEEGRLHYLALLSRYLATTHGPREGARRLATLLTSQQEARQLVELLRQVDLTPREPCAELATSMAMLTDRFHLVCEAARGSLAKQAAEDGLEGTRPSTPLPRSSPEAGGGTVEQVGRILSRLAQCEDPNTLAEARRILPPPLLQRFLHILLSPAQRRVPRTPPQCAPPSPCPSPPSPQCRKLSIMRHAGEPPPPTAVPRGLHHLPAASHAPELAAE